MPKIKLILPAILAGIILGGAGCSLFTENTLIDLKNEDKKEVIAESNSEVPTEVGDTSDWQTYTNEEYGFSFKYPEAWFVIEDESKGRIYIRNVQGKTSKGNRPADFQQILISTWEQDINADTENNVKIGQPYGREFGGNLSTGTINRNGFIINTYEYSTLGGKTLEAFWNDKSGKRYYATNSTEVGQENQQKMVENLKKILSTFEFIN